MKKSDLMESVQKQMEGYAQGRIGADGREVNFPEKPAFLIFGGTSEGRELAEFFSGRKIPATLCVATEYGEEVLPKELPWIRVRTGRMDEAEMEELFLQMAPLAVVDATHPYAEAVTENIRLACEKTGNVYYRLLRKETPLETFDHLRVFDDCASAADWLETQAGNVLLTTGMKELPEFAARLTDKSRIYARMLLQEDVPSQTERLGLVKKQVICMQGPFSKEMNVATLHMTDAAFLVTKESGKNGGFAEKAEAARDAGAVCVVIRRPVRETGYSLEEICKILSDVWESRGKKKGCSVLKKGVLPREKNEAEESEQKTISLVGIGMGDARQLTFAAAQACDHADCIIGARRMLDAIGAYIEWKRQDFKDVERCAARQDGQDSCDKAMIPLYKADEIVDFIREHPAYEKIVVAFSGDIGFYSGAKKLLGKIEDTPELGAYDVRLFCGISSAAYFAARLHMPWEDMTLVSAHGREQNLVSAVQKNERVFALASDAASIRAMAKKLTGFGLGGVSMYVGADLSYPTERVDAGVVRDFQNYGIAGAGDADLEKEAKPDKTLCVAVFENPRAGKEICTHGIPDSAFVRGKVPMTKEEVRSVSLSKLRLTRDAVVYDIGAGTGSVSVECARMADRGKVYAVEWKEDARKLIAENRKRFAVSNLEIVAGRAPEALKDLPAPTHAFIGGSGGDLKRILQTLSRKNPNVRVVVNCITLETLSETLAAAPEIGFALEDLVSVSIAKSKCVGDYHMMMGQNPVYVITLTKELPQDLSKRENE